MTEQTGLRERRRNELVSRVHQIAADLVAEHGYEGMTAALIATHAGISQSTFFRHFETKADAVFWPLRNLTVLLESFDPPREPHQLRVALNQLYAEHFAAQSDEQTRFLIWLHALTTQDLPLRNALAAHERQIEDLIHSRLKEAGLPATLDTIVSIEYCSALGASAIRHLACNVPLGQATTAQLVKTHQLVAQLRLP
ncbi:TetR/AcrR family transcriptional regulator [Glutamicibacter sp.]|uniref:TetR/AcrR family transcriptional regulator n=1 Tax=Glutamicibacter sp. TaxID=1931995 RepID=UPI0028BE3699|nr:TetR/AcrR family transcriptional regulator [Glutamicibacter sp.]